MFVWCILCRTLYCNGTPGVVSVGCLYDVYCVVHCIVMVHLGWCQYGVCMMYTVSYTVL